MSDWVRYNPTTKNWEDSNNNGSSFFELPFHIGNRPFGIGTSNPDASHQLEVYRPGDTVRLNVRSDDAQVSVIRLGRISDTLGPAFYRPASTLDLRVQLDGSDRMWFLQGGDVGIGVSPSVKLHIKATGAEIARFESTNADGAYINIKLSTDANFLKLGSQRGITGSGSTNQVLLDLPSGDLAISGGIWPATTDADNMGNIINRWYSVVSQYLTIADAPATPTNVSGHVTIYGGGSNTMKVKFADGTIKTFTLT